MGRVRTKSENQKLKLKNPVDLPKMPSSQEILLDIRNCDLNDPLLCAVPDKEGQFDELFAVMTRKAESKNLKAEIQTILESLTNTRSRIVSYLPNNNLQSE